MTSNSGRSNQPLSTSSRGLGYWLKKRPMVTLAIFVLSIAVLWYASSGPSDSSLNGNKKGGNTSLNATPVVVAAVRKDNLDIFIFGLGVVTPLNTVEVSSRVDGQLLSVTFEEGQIVKQGDQLAQVDPAPFEVEHNLAQGQLIRDQALLDKAKVDLIRYQKLLEQDSISVQLVDTKESLVRQYQAAVKAGEGAVKSASLKLTYAKIIAPIGGRLGFRQVDAGNIVSASNRKGIVNITQLDPISVIFPIPEDTLPLVMKLLKAGDRIPVEIYDRGMKKKLAKGRLLAVDNQIDATTGTIKLKAEFPNADGTLFANQFVNVKMSVKTRVDATLVPTVAIQRGVVGTFVYAVKNNNTVSVTPVTTGPVQGEVTVIESGVAVGDRIVIEGGDRLREGASIKIIVRDAPLSDNQDEQAKSPATNDNN